MAMRERKPYYREIANRYRKDGKVINTRRGIRLKGRKKYYDEVIENMINNNRLEIKQDVKIKLSGISASTIDRMLEKEFR
jgi:hypothetical protein